MSTKHTNNHNTTNSVQDDISADVPSASPPAPPGADPVVWRAAVKLAKVKKIRQALARGELSLEEALVRLEVVKNE